MVIADRAGYLMHGNVAVCGCCGVFRLLSGTCTRETFPAVATSAIQAGWQATETYGWVCPRCADALAETLTRQKRAALEAYRRAVADRARLKEEVAMLATHRAALRAQCAELERDVTDAAD